MARAKREVGWRVALSPSLDALIVGAGSVTLLRSKDAFALNDREAANLSAELAAYQAERRGATSVPPAGAG